MTTKAKVVLVTFPFDDLSTTKVRPAVCLTNPVGSYNHVILALITSKAPSALLETDIVLNPSHPDFAASGLHKASTIRLDMLITVRTSVIQREIGELSKDMQEQIANKLCEALSD